MARTLARYAYGSQYVRPALWWTEMRVSDVARSRIALSVPGSVSTAQTRKIESAIDSVVRVVRSGCRLKLHHTKRAHVIARLRHRSAPPCRAARSGRRSAPRADRGSP